MRNFIALGMIKRMGARYDDDVSYALHLLAHSPKAFWKFARVTALSRHREQAPAEAVLTVKLLGTMNEDCGPCTQLVVHFAKEAQMAADQVEAVLRRDQTAMSPAVALAYRYGAAVLSRSPDAHAAREAVRACWGEKGLIDLAVAMQATRLFPMLKDALGFALECRRVSVDGRSVDVAKQVA